MLSAYDGGSADTMRCRSCHLDDRVRGRNMGAFAQGVLVKSAKQSSLEGDPYADSERRPAGYVVARCCPQPAKRRTRPAQPCRRSCQVACLPLGTVAVKPMRGAPGALKRGNLEIQRCVVCDVCG